MDNRIEALLESVDVLLTGATCKETAENSHAVLKHVSAGIRHLDLMVEMEEIKEQLTVAMQANTTLEEENAELTEKLMQLNAGNEPDAVSL